MKTISKIMMLIALLVVVACNSNDNPDNPIPQEEFGSVEFSFDVKESDESEGGRKVSAGRAENVVPDRIVISIRNAAGTLVYDAHTMPLQLIGGAYVTNQLTLVTGDYEITEYFVEDADGNTIYVTPKEGSALEHLVNDPLPIDLPIAKDVNSQVSPEVVSPDGFTPEDFGYPSFRLNIVETIDFLVSVHIVDVQTALYELTPARVVITGDGNTIYDSVRVAATNQIRVRGGFTNYRVVISKDGYLPFDQTYDQATLESYQTSPLYVLLDPNVTNHIVDPNVNSVTGGTGLVVGAFQAGQLLRVYADPNDLWAMHPNGLESNADGIDGEDHTDLGSGFTGLLGSMVGSWDDGASYFEIGTYEEFTAPGNATLTLWCFDADTGNNQDSITASVQVFN